VEQLLDVLLLLLPEQFAADEDVFRGLLVEEVAAHLVNVLLGHLLHAELASPLHHLLMPANHPPQSHDNRTIICLAFVFLPLDEEGRLSEMRDPNLDIVGSAHFGGRCKLLIFYYTPTKIFLKFFSAQSVHTAELSKCNLYLLLIIVFPEWYLAGFAGGY